MEPKLLHLSNDAYEVSWRIRAFRVALLRRSHPTSRIHPRRQAYSPRLVPPFSFRKFSDLGLWLDGM